MDNETQHLDAARVPAGSPPSVPPAGPGTPTTYLPPVGAPPSAGPGPAPAYTTAFPPPPVPPAPPAGPVFAPPAPNAGTTYAAPGPHPPPAGPAYQPAGPGPRPMGAWTNTRANSWVPLVLIGLGLWALLGSMQHVFGAAIPFALGLIFLYVSTQGPHRWGFRIPGAILTGLGAGIIVDTLGFGAGYSAIGLGLGFVALWYWQRAQWWWLIPGAIITLGGLEGVMSTSGWHTSWILPLALIAFGAYLLSGRQWRTRRP